VREPEVPEALHRRWRGPVTRKRRGYGTALRRYPEHSIRERVGAARTTAEVDVLLAAARATGASGATLRKIERVAAARRAALEAP
jgi:hypothetical protein